MSMLGIARGLRTVVTGVASDNLVQVGKGIVGTSISSIGTVITYAVDRELGENLSETGEQINEDEN